MKEEVKSKPSEDIFKVIFRPISNFLTPKCHKCGQEALQEAYCTDGAREAIVPCCKKEGCMETATEKAKRFLQFYK